MTVRDLYEACLGEQGRASGWCAAYQHMLDDEPRLLLKHSQAIDALTQREGARC